MKQREFPIISTLPPPRDASEKTLRLCDTEQDAIAAAIVLACVSQAEIARRMGVSGAFVTMLKTGERTLTARLLPMFCAATGSNLVRQYRTLQSLVRIAAGQPRAVDRIAAIASYTQVERRVA